MIGNIFQYLEKVKGKKIPFIYKLLHDIPLTEDESIVNGNLYLSYSKIKKLPDNLTVDGDLFMRHCIIITLPNNLYIKNNLYITLTNISELPEDLCVDGNLWCFNTPLAKRIKNDVSLLNYYSKQVKGKIFYEW